MSASLAAIIAGCLTLSMVPSAWSSGSQVACPPGMVQAEAARPGDAVVCVKRDLVGAELQVNVGSAFAGRPGTNVQPATPARSTTRSAPAPAAPACTYRQLTDAELAALEAAGNMPVSSPSPSNTPRTPAHLPSPTPEPMPGFTPAPAASAAPVATRAPAPQRRHRPCPTSGTPLTRHPSGRSAGA
jgi:hypothetical protein